MDINTIRKQVAEKGYASLTSAQKDIYNNVSAQSAQPVISIPTPSLSFGTPSTGTYDAAGVQATQQEAARQEAIRKKEADRRTWMQAAQAMQRSGSSNTIMQQWLNSVPAEFRNDAAQSMGISVTPTPTTTTTPTGKIAVTLGNGQVVYVDNQGNFTDASGNPVSNTTVASSTATSGVLPNTPSPQYDNALADLLNNPNLTADQKTSIKQLFDVLSLNDTAKANKMIAAFNAATTYSSPYFKAQTLIATTALQEGLSSITGDYNYKIGQQQSTINQLKSNLEAIQGYGSFEQTQDYQNLIRSYQKDLETTQENMAATGKTTSSVRNKAEQLLNEQKTGLVESGRRTFGYNVSKLTGGITDTQNTMAYLTSKETQDRIAALRKAEEAVGTSALSPLLPGLGYSTSDLLGGIGGTIPRQEIASGLSFANNFVF